MSPRAIVAMLLIALLAAAGPVGAQEPDLTGTYSVDWSQWTFGIQYPEFDSGSRVMDVARVPNPGPGDPTWQITDRAAARAVCWVWSDHSLQCLDAIGYFRVIYSGLPNEIWFVMDLQGLSAHSPSYRWEVGTFQPPAPATSVSFNLSSGQVVSGTVGVKMTVKGLGPGPDYWYTSVDGRQISTRRETVTTITLFWDTRGVANGSHTFSVNVVDAAGAVATGGVSVLVRN